MAYESLTPRRLYSERSVRQEAADGYLAEPMDAGEVGSLLGALSSHGMEILRLSLLRQPHVEPAVPSGEGGRGAAPFHPPPAAEYTTIPHRLNTLREVSRDFPNEMPFGPEDMEWACGQAAARPVMVAEVNMRVPGHGAVHVMVAKDVDGWFHVRVMGRITPRYFRCDQEQGLADLAEDLGKIIGAQ